VTNLGSKFLTFIYFEVIALSDTQHVIYYPGVLTISHHTTPTTSTMIPTIQYFNRGITDIKYENENLVMVIVNEEIRFFSQTSYTYTTSLSVPTLSKGIRNPADST
jgi:hypothetical protein